MASLRHSTHLFSEVCRCVAWVLRGFYEDFKGIYVSFIGILTGFRGVTQTFRRFWIVSGAFHGVREDFREISEVFLPSHSK